MIRLSAFADEVTETFAGQVSFLNKAKVKYIEPRFFDNHKNVMDLTVFELKNALKLLKDYGISVSAIGSPIGKIGIDEPFDKHLKNLNTLSNWRMFSKLIGYGYSVTTLLKAETFLIFVTKSLIAC